MFIKNAHIEYHKFHDESIPFSYLCKRKSIIYEVMKLNYEYRDWIFTWRLHKIAWTIFCNWRNFDWGKSDCCLNNYHDRFKLSKRRYIYLFPKERILDRSQWIMFFLICEIWNTFPQRQFLFMKSQKILIIPFFICSIDSVICLL